MKTKLTHLMSALALLTLSTLNFQFSTCLAQGAGIRRCETGGHPGVNQKLEGRSEKAEGQIAELKAENAELKARLEKLEQIINTKNGGQP